MTNYPSLNVNYRIAAGIVQAKATLNNALTERASKRNIFYCKYELFIERETLYIVNKELIETRKLDAFCCK